jgi:hypothetical protein
MAAEMTGEHEQGPVGGLGEQAVARGAGHRRILAETAVDVGITDLRR